MDAEARKKELKEVKSTNARIQMTGIPLRYRGSTITENVYKIPLSYLVYNKYNGRIGTEVKSYEVQNGELNVETEHDKKKIEEFLYNSKRDRNKKTMDSLLKDGQQRYGIVTADGKIVDGNRRAMLLNTLFNEREKLGYSYSQVEKCQYFLAIILPEDATEKDMQQLETIYQMGEDDKLDYNAIEKYLKCKELKKYFSEKDIAEFMGESEKQIIKKLSILNLMEEYLETYGYTGIYTRLEKTEGPFVDLDGYLESYKKGGANVSGVDWPYDELDINELKIICFDYIRARYEGKEFRDIAKTGKDGSIFAHKDIWESFKALHMEKVPEDEFTTDELREKFPNEDLSNLLKSRDADWTKKARGELEGNLRKHSSKVDDKRNASKPLELLEKALSALNSVDTNQSSFFEDENVVQCIKDISKISWEMKKLLDRKC
ncbi:hypothetical protein [Sedimentibacter saalensis]|uniref:hypothetical protein n=1 Tax=Sedimentibacter saalensis TaxID=130788 RepID=UPI00289EAD63|nr:hypothetical protein [Sedimentibacter saalensis]